MTESASPLGLPTRRLTVSEKGAAEATSPHMTQNLEDRRLAERVERALYLTGYMALRGIEVGVCGRLVILGGRVPSYYLKQLAQATALTVPGTNLVRNDLDVGSAS